MNEKRREKMEEQLAKKAKTIEEYASTVVVLNDNDVVIDGNQYELVKNYHSGFQIDKLRERFSPVLTKFDYIVGDIGYDQLRLHGLYDNNRKVAPSQKISSLEDYLYEYCNFGCAYFVLKNCEVHDSFPLTNSRRGKKHQKKHSYSVENHHRKNSNRGKQKVILSQSTAKNRNNQSHSFVIRKKKNNSQRRFKNGK